jgi:hypothetical protein
MCNFNGMNYMETDIASGGDRTYLFTFRGSGGDYGEMRWSTQYGDGIYNRGNAMCASNDKVWVVGRSNFKWTLVDYNEQLTTDYYKTFPGPISDATIARFDIPTIVGTDQSTHESSKQKLVIYPNPSENLIYINSHLLNQSQSAFIQVYDAFGKLLISKKYAVGIPIDISELAVGAYMLRLESEQGVITQKFVKK